MEGRVARARWATADYYERCVEFSEAIWESRDALIMRMHGAGAKHGLIAKELGMSLDGVKCAVARLRREMLGL